MDVFSTLQELQFVGKLRRIDKQRKMMMEMISNRTLNIISGKCTAYSSKLVWNTHVHYTKFVCENPKGRKGSFRRQRQKDRYNSNLEDNFNEFIEHQEK